MANNQVKLKMGTFEGVRVFKHEGEIFVEVPKYEKKVMDQFKGKIGEEFYSSFYNNSKALPVEPHISLLKINPKMLETDKQIVDFNNRVNSAVFLHEKIKKDFEDIQYIVSFDHSQDGKDTIFRFGQDRTADKELKNWAYGEIVSVNDSYVALSSGSNDKAVFFRVLPTERFLLDWKEERNAQEVLSERLKVGDTVKLTWNENRKIEVQLAEPRQKIQTQEQAVAMSA